jgi:hypothetical protein
VLDALPTSPVLSSGALLLLGVALLVAGRRLFWLAVGALGFVAGLAAVERLAPDLSRGAALLVALAAGLAGLVLAIVVQKAAVALAGFLLGVVLMTRLLPPLGLDLGPWQWVVVAAGGLLAAFAALALFGVALGLLTAGAGAALVVEGLPLSATVAPVVLVVLWAVGAAIQLGRGRRRG